MNLCWGINPIISYFLCVCVEGFLINFKLLFMHLCLGVINCNIPNLLSELQIPMGFEWKHEGTHLELKFTRNVELHFQRFILSQFGVVLSDWKSCETRDQGQDFALEISRMDRAIEKGVMYDYHSNWNHVLQGM